METRPLPIALAAQQGAHHLPSLAAEIHRTYFFKMPPLRVCWGHQIARKRRRSIRLGSYNHHTTDIRIHPSLNAPEIPTYFIQSIIHHEYLHHVLGPHHNRRFHHGERQFRYHRESKEWLRRNLWVLLGMPRKRRAAVTASEKPQLALF